MTYPAIADTTKAVQQALVALGWPLTVDGSYGPRTFEAVTDFQRLYVAAALAPDGWAGPQTRYALGVSVELDGHVSPHYRAKDFASLGNRWIRSHRELIAGLERLCTLLGRKARITSAYRDPAHNARVGGAKSSQHLYGLAVDIDERDRLPTPTVEALRVFSGLGSLGPNVLHVDVRHVDPKTNTTRGRTDHPTKWSY